MGEVGGFYGKMVHFTIKDCRLVLAQRKATLAAVTMRRQQKAPPIPSDACDRWRGSVGSHDPAMRQNVDIRDDIDSRRPGRRMQGDGCAVRVERQKLTGCDYVKAPVSYAVYPSPQLSLYLRLRVYLSMYLSIYIHQREGMLKSQTIIRAHSSHHCL